MPLTRSAVKKLRKDRKIEERNKVFEKQLSTVLKKAKKEKGKKIIKAISLIDKAVKKNVYHKNKAARLKSVLSKLTTDKQAKTKSIEKTATPKSPSKKSTKK